MAYSCSCVAGKGFCNHVVALLYQTAHYSQLSLPTIPPPLACTSDLQRWHRPRTQGIHPEPVNDVVVQKPTTVGKSGLSSTLYQAYSGPFPDPDMMASGAKLRQEQPQPLIALVLDGMSEIELTPSKFGPEKSSDLILHHLAPEFPGLPFMQHTFSKLHFVPTLHQLMDLQSLQVSPQMTREIEKGTRQQSKCPAWTQLRQPRLTASRFQEACSSWEGSVDPESAANCCNEVGSPNGVRGPGKLC